jgi:hypothetical protein
MGWFIPIIVLLLASCATVQPRTIDMSEALNEAMSMCGIHDQMTAKLEEDYGETQAWIAMLDNQLVIEMFVNEQSRSFTMLVTNNSGLACLFTSGTSYHQVQGWE